MYVDLETAKQKVTEVFEEFGDADLNEAETRFKLIDDLLFHVGWRKNEFHLERYENGVYTDYELGRPKQAILEAKRTEKQFDIAMLSERSVSIKSLRQIDQNVKDIFDQCRSYCLDRGVPVGICTNGKQYIFFAAMRSDGKSPLDGHAIVFRNPQDIIVHFADFWKLVSPDGISTGHAYSVLRGDGPSQLPAKLRTTIEAFGGRRYKNAQQETLSHLSQIVLEDIPQTLDTEDAFLEQCYCSPGAISGYSMLTDKIMRTRYQGISNDDVSVGAKGAPNTASITPEVWNESLTKRPTIVIGDAGVGKTTFIKNLLRTSKADDEEFVIQIDLGVNQTFKGDVDGFILDEIERQFLNRYKLDLFERNFVRGVWDLEIRRFRDGVESDLFEIDPKAAELKLIEFLKEKITNRSDHVRQCIDHLVKGRGQRVIIVLDNADQRTSKFQEDIFLKSQEIASVWNALVFVTLRPVTYYRSKKMGAASAYSNRVFTIFPPKPDEVLDRRLNFALDLVEGRVSLPDKKINLKIETVSLVLRALKVSLQSNKSLVEFLANITGGNIRELVRLTSRFIGSANVDFDKIVEIQKGTGRYIIPVHEFQKEVLLGEYKYFDPEASLACNVFDIFEFDPKEHFLDLYLLAFLDSQIARHDSDGFVDKFGVFDEMEALGYPRNLIIDHLDRLTEKRLIENNLHVDDNEESGGLISSEIHSVRVTSIGSYHRRIWASTFSFIDCMLIDTPILNQEILEQIAYIASSFSIRNRFTRSRAFRSYLDSVWTDFCKPTPYFDWPTLRNSGDATFQSVSRATRKY